MQGVEDQVGQPQRCEVAEHDRGDQVEADAGPAEQDDQDGVDAERDSTYIRRSSLVVTRLRSLTADDEPADADRRRPFQRLPGCRGGLQHVVNALEARGSSARRDRS